MKKYLAYDGINCEYENFNTIEEARKWLVEAFLDSSDGYHPDLKSCAIYKLEETVDYDVIDSKDNYKYMYDDEIPEDDEESEAWPVDVVFDEIWKHKFVKVEND